MISFVLANARRTPGINAQSAPSTAAAAHIAMTKSGVDVDISIAELERDPRRADGSEVELSLGADVEELHAKRGGGSQAR